MVSFFGEVAARYSTQKGGQMKKQIAVILSVLFCFVLFFAGMVSASSAPIKMRILHSYPDNTRHGLNMARFEELVEKYTDGRVDVEIYSNASICPINKEVTTVLTGGAEACYNVGSIIENVDRAEAIWMIPYLLRINLGEVRHIKAVMSPDSKVEQILKERQAKKGLYRLGSITTVDGFVFYNNQHPLTTWKDFKGLKMRHPGGLFGELIFRELGANPIVIPGTEVPVALQTNVIDGLTTTLMHYHDARWHTKYATPSYWAGFSLPLLVNLKWWNNLPDDIQKIIAGKVMPEIQEWAWDQVNSETAKKVKEMQNEPFNVKVNFMDRAAEKEIEKMVQAKAIKVFQEAVGKDVADTMIECVRTLTPEDLKD